jgi:SPX domain protein involved in polyphosphate accumulation
MDSVALLNRIDTKYILSSGQLYQALNNLKYSYQILEINNERIHHYRTLYYDTDAFDLYTRHVTGRAEVYKVRSREYTDTHLTFLEVKHKDQKRRTEKSRMPLPGRVNSLCGDFDDFLQGHNPFSSSDLRPKLWNVFKRITLVSKRNLERVTFDINLSFFNERDELALNGIAIAEVKQTQFSNGSAFMNEMRNQGIRGSGFSKYCYGVSQLYRDVKRNSQKDKMLMINKLQHGGIANA